MIDYHRLIMPGDIYPKLFAKLQCYHVRPSLWHLMHTDDGKCENKLLLLFFSAILKILPGIKSLISEDRNVNENVAENNRLNYQIQSLHVGM